VNIQETICTEIDPIFAKVQLSDCYIYHWFDLPDGGEAIGSWDLRGTFHAYLGELDFGGMRVLEVGPASGFLGLQMERMGAKVVAFDLAHETAPNLLPQPGMADQELHRLWISAIRTVHNSWWYFRQIFNSTNTVVYGDVYNLPKTIGRFDIAIFGAVLLHLYNPFEALRQAAAVTDQMIVVTDMIYEDTVDKPYLLFSPDSTKSDPLQWWRLSPCVVSRMLDILGFETIKSTRHMQRAHPHLTRDEYVDHEFFTVVGRRREPRDPRRVGRGDDRQPTAAGAHRPP